MYEDTYMYAIERNPEYLAHYGIRGMKWGVRKAREMGGARGAKRLGRQYAKAQKKLAKLEKQAGKSKKYARRAALMGAGAAAAGGLAVAGTTGVGNAMTKLASPAARAGKGIGYAMAKVPGRNKVSSAIRRTGANMYLHSGKINTAMRDAGSAVRTWGKGNSLSVAAGRAVGNTKLPTGVSSRLVKATGNNMAGYGEKIRKSGVSNNTIARIGAGAAGAVLAAGAARNAYKAATAQKKAARFKSEMNKAFAGTKYANGGNRQGKKRRRSNKA